MAAEARVFQNGLVNDQLHLVFPVVHQPQHAHGTGCDVQKPPHILRRGKRQPRHAELFGKVLRLEDLFARHHQKIEARLLPVAEKQILADFLSQHLLHRFAGFNCVREVVVDSVIRNAERIKQRIARDFLFQPVGHVLRSAVI